MTESIKTEVVVIGSGPGGYTAAFRAADLGKKVVLIERFDTLGGVCLNVGCIPSKALLHAAKVINEAKDSSHHGISFQEPEIDLDKLRSWKESIINKLTQGLAALSKQRKVNIVTGDAKFISSTQVEVATKKGAVTVEFENAIIAVGSSPIRLPFFPDDERLIDSTGALELKDIPNEMLVLGGGIIGMEMGTVYNALGAQVSVVELTPGLIPGADKDMVMPLQKRVKGSFKSIMLETKVTNIEAKPDGLWVSFEGKQAPKDPVRYDRVLAAIGRAPNGKNIDAEKAGVNVDERGFISVDSQMRTNVNNIFAIGDVVGNPMLAHKAIPEGKIAAEVIAGKKHYFDPKCIPAVAYTDPEIAWVGLTEIEAKEKGIQYEKGAFPWMASGRALSMSREEGMTKVLFDPSTNRVLGAGIVGVNAGDLISEAALAIEMGCDAEDLALTIHPHPTLSETMCQSAEAFEGSITDLYMPKKTK